MKCPFDLQIGFMKIMSNFPTRIPSRSVIFIEKLQDFQLKTSILAKNHEIDHRFY